jgi:hypothetical protein
VAGVILIVGIICFAFVLGKIEPIPDPAPSNARAVTTA